MWPPRPPVYNPNQPFAGEEYAEDMAEYDAYLNQLDDERHTPDEGDE